MRSKEKLEKCISLLINKDKICSLDNSEKARLELYESLLKDLEVLEEIRNTFKVEKEETINQNHYWLIVKKKPYYSYMITKEQYNNWKGWLKNGK